MDDVGPLKLDLWFILNALDNVRFVNTVELQWLEH